MNFFFLEGKKPSIYFIQHRKTLINLRQLSFAENSIYNSIPVHSVWTSFDVLLSSYAHGCPDLNCLCLSGNQDEYQYSAHQMQEMTGALYRHDRCCQYSSVEISSVFKYLKNIKFEKEIVVDILIKSRSMMQGAGLV